MSVLVLAGFVLAGSANILVLIEARGDDEAARFQKADREVGRPDSRTGS
jgi:hypothetical protein